MDKREVGIVEIYNEHAAREGKESVVLLFLDAEGVIRDQFGYTNPEKVQFFKDKLAEDRT